VSYLLEKSTTITKQELLDHEEDYYTYEKFEIDNRYIITDIEKPFFSIYDIANYCKKKFEDDKLFLIVHRYYDSLKNEKITEFYIMNSVDIFEDSVTSILSVSYDELIDKQHVVQNNLKIAMTLLDCDSFHIILGDNIKLHEVSEYILSSNDDKSEFEVFDENDRANFSEKDTEDIRDYLEENNHYRNLKTSTISSILNSVRIIEPKGSKVKKMIVLVAVVAIAFIGSKDIADMIFEDSLYGAKKELRVEQSKLKKIRDDYDFKNNASLKLRDRVKVLNKQQVYIPKKDTK
jgi:hypothetical protein